MAKFLHAADIHLDSPLQKLAAYDHAPIEKIRGASRRALAAMVELAIEQRVDAVLIAGDLYDGNWNDQNTGLQFVKQAARLVDSGIAVLVIRGNHDAENVMTASLPLPTNPDGSSIMMSARHTETRILDDAGLAVHGRSFATRAVTENLSVDYPPPVAGLTNVAMLHTSLSGAEGHDTYSPCTAEYLTGKQYDYWALGHVHTRADHAIGDGRVPIVFPGNLQGRHIRECGPKGCMIVETDSTHRCTPTFHALDEVRWERLVIDAASLSDPREVTDRYQQWLEDELASSPPLLVTRVEVRGETPLAASLRRYSVQTEADLRSVAVAMADGQVWMEDFRLRVENPTRQAVRHDSAPRQSILAAGSELMDEPEIAKLLEEEFKSLQKKLPVEILADDGDDAALSLGDPDWSRGVLQRATSELEARIDDS